MSTFHKKKFIAAGEAYVDKQRREWIAGKSANINIHAMALLFAVREGWLLDTEDLDSITALNLFPCADIIPHANAVDRGAETELHAKLAISAAVRDGIAQAEAGIRTVQEAEARFLTPSKAATGVLGPGTKDCAMDGVPAPPAASGRAVAGHIEAVATDVIRVHRANIGGTEVYTTQRNIMDTLQAAQVQGITLQVDYDASGDFGNRVVGCKVTDAVKGQ